jgi:hypothetical protein
MSETWIKHEIVGGEWDGKRIHSPCRNEGIWFALKANTVVMDSHGIVTADTKMRKFSHRVSEDGRHFYEQQ